MSIEALERFVDFTARTSEQVPQLSTQLTWDDTLARWGFRWGIGRMKARVEPGLYRIGEPTPAGLAGAPEREFHGRHRRRRDAPRPEAGSSPGPPDPSAEGRQETALNVSTASVDKPPGSDGMHSPVDFSFL